jgi:glycogen synthase
MGAPMRRAAERALRARVATAGPLDGLIQHGGEHLAPPGIPMVTYQDSTLVQALRSYPWPHLRGLGGRGVDRATRRQRAVYASAAACCTMTHWAAASVRSDYGVDAARVHVVGLGPNHDPEPGPERDWSSPRFLFVGVDWERKNGAAVVRAFDAVRERIPTASLDLVGGHPRVDGEGITGHGRLDLRSSADATRMRGLYRRATVFVMPSLHEPSGTVHLEAAAAGIPSIGSADGGAVTCIGDGGRVVDPLDSGVLLAAMLELSEPETARALGARARAHSALFTWKKVAERLVRALELPGVETSDLADYL